MSTHDEKVRLKITLTEEEKTKLERLVVYCPEMTEECLRFERLVLLLQEVEMGPPQSRALALWGKEHPRNGELSPLAAEAMNGV